MSDPTVKDIKKDLFLMMHKAEQMLELAEDAFMKNKVASLDQAAEILREIQKKEDALTESLAKLSPSNAEARAILAVPAHMEKIGTSVERILNTIHTKIKEGLLFSDRAIQETAQLLTKSKEVLKKAGDAMVTGNAASSDQIRKESDVIIDMANKFSTSHEERLVAGECSPKTSSAYLCMLYAFDDIASHTKDALKKMASK